MARALLAIPVRAAVRAYAATLRPAYRSDRLVDFEQLPDELADVDRAVHERREVRELRVLRAHVFAEGFRYLDACLAHERLEAAHARLHFAAGDLALHVHAALHPPDRGAQAHTIRITLGQVVVEPDMLVDLDGLDVMAKESFY
ncbi:MAG TPA: hypothetical protein VK216_02145 [Magnetospirillaceae bacterium]|nr:hypothetical protein [Magnetospirillaceae bacterium]